MGVDIHELIQELEWYQKNQIPDIQPEYLDDIITVLKEREPVGVKCITKRVLIDDTYDAIYKDENFYDCPVCGQRFSRGNKNTSIKFCWTCGQAVKWE